MSINYAVHIQPFAERHFIHTFKKKYKGAWDITWKAIEREMQNIDSLFDTNIVDTITDTKEIKICRTEFRVAGTQESRHGSGNRCIVAIHKATCAVHVLLVYGKTDLRGSNETAEWKRIIRDNYPEYKNICV